MRRLGVVVCLALLLPLIVARTAHAQTGPLPSWNEGEVKQTIVKFVQAVTSRDSAEYVAPEARIATFDNDGTLWSEQPMYSGTLRVRPGEGARAQASGVDE
jgi:hypothetical protein